MDEFEKRKKFLEEETLVSDETLKVALYIGGATLKTLDQIAEIVLGKNFAQLKEENIYEDIADY